LRKAINTALLQQLAGPGWQQITERYLGK